MKIGLHYNCLMGWQGGRDLFRLLFDCLQAGCEPDDQVAILAQKVRDALPWRLARLGKHVLSRYPWDRDWMAREIVRTSTKESLRRTFGHSVRLEWTAAPTTQSDRSRVSSAFDVIGPLCSPPSDNGAAWVGYIPDCQHRRLPQNFTAEERAQRDRAFSNLLKLAPVVIVASKDAKGDITNYYGPTRAEIVTLPFAASSRADWFDIDVKRLLTKYNLPSNFFICSNQFWIHKNHAVIVEALAIAKAEGSAHRVVFTGDTYDYRDPGYFQRLVQRAEELGVAQNCHFLGLLPKLDQIGLMQAAMAVIQPTLFEGGPGGGVVYDAVALGKRVLLSDIPINREIEPYVDEYFAPADARALHRAMSRAEEQVAPARPKDLLLRESQERRRKCGSVLRSAFALAVERSKLRAAVPSQH
jgi:glycosyltransferase involved in cell wall biosynthesis